MNSPGSEVFSKGATGVLWGLAGLTLVYVAFLGPQLQILHQKEDLRLTREAFKQQQVEMELQTAEFENQRFDTTFLCVARGSPGAGEEQRNRYRQGAAIRTASSSLRANGRPTTLAEATP